MSPPAIGDGLSVRVQAHDDLVLVSLAGPLDIYTVPGFRREVEAHALAGAQIVIDLTEATLLDSAGLSALISLRNEAQRNGPGGLGLVCPRRSVLRLLEITCLDQAFSVGADLPEVRAALAGPGGHQPGQLDPLSPTRSRASQPSGRTTAARSGH